MGLSSYSRTSKIPLTTPCTHMPVRKSNSGGEGDPEGGEDEASGAALLALAACGPSSHSESARRWNQPPPPPTLPAVNDLAPAPLASEAGAAAGGRCRAGLAAEDACKGLPAVAARGLLPTAGPTHPMRLPPRAAAAAEAAGALPTALARGYWEAGGGIGVRRAPADRDGNSRRSDAWAPGTGPLFVP